MMTQKKKRGPPRTGKATLIGLRLQPGPSGAPITSSSLLFPSPAIGTRISAWSQRMAQLRQASGVEFTLHDLRRTCRTLMSRLDVGEDIAELAIGHVRADLVARYNKDQAWEGRCDAFTRVSDHVAALLGHVGAEGKVVAIRRDG